MATFLMLSTVGPDGAATLTENPDRLKAVNAEVEAMGVKVVAQWALLGQYDFCTVLDAPDETTMARVALVLGSRGTLKTLTLSAIPIDEYIEGVLRPGRADGLSATRSPGASARGGHRRGEELAERAAVGQPADAVALVGDLGDLEAAHPRALVPVPHVDLGPRGERRPRCASVGPPRRRSRPHRMRCAPRDR